MTKIFVLPYCTNNLRHYLKPLSTTEELCRLKQYFSYQKNLAIRLIKYQRLLISKYNRQSIRYNQKSSENLQFLPIRSNRLSNLSNINKRQTSVNSIDHTETQIKNPNTIIIKLNTCSTLIASGHGIAQNISSVINSSTEQSNHGLIDEDISLSKTCNKIFNQFFVSNHFLK